MSLLDIRKLSVSFASDEGAIPAVQEVSFSIEPGEIVGLIGESGSGKTAIANTLMGFLPEGAHASGSARFLGQELIGACPKALQKIRGKHLSMIFQDPMTALNPTWTIGAQLIEAIRIHAPLSRAAARQKAAELLRRVGIDNSALRLAQYPHELSGGLRQRALIAMALVHSPDLIIADELTTALDILTKQKLIDLLLELQSSFGSAFLVISHDLAFVKRLADRTCVLYSGRLCEIAPTHELFSHPRHPYTEGLLASLPAWACDKDEPLFVIEGAIPQPTPLHTGCPFAPRCAKATPACRQAPPSLDSSGVACIHAPKKSKPPRKKKPADVCV